MDDRIGNYRVEHAIGSSRYGAIYQVVHLILPRRAVIKVMHEAHVATGVVPAAVHVLREACLLEALRHPGVPQLYESGMLPDRRPWFAYERIAGPTLADRLARGPLAPREVAAIVRDLADTLEHAHRRGIVHRGLRPDRIVLSPDRMFGVAIVDWSDAHTHDASTRIPHVPAADARHYIAPELARGDQIDDRADIYALGVIAYQALTGVLPRDHVPLAERMPEAPRELAQLIDQMLAADRFDRPASAEVRADLDWLASVAPPAVEMPRIRKPRWTPPYTDITRDHAEVFGEIDPEKRR